MRLLVVEYLSLRDAIWLVRQRGLAMQNATDEYIKQTKENVGMSLVLTNGHNLDHILEVLQTTILPKYKSMVSLAAVNLSSQFVLSGMTSAISQALIELDQCLAKSKQKVLKSRQLPVSGPFHSPIMEPAKKVMQDIVDSGDITFNWPPKYPTISNITTRPFRSVEEIKSTVVNTLTTTVQWKKSLEYVVDKSFPQTDTYHNVVSIGLGKYARHATDYSEHLGRRLKTKVLSIATLDELEKLIKELK